MSLITRCPACATLFRVVPDQLKISDGWVRCGQCSEVFDAQLTLQAAPTGSPPEPVRQPKPEATPAPTPAPQAVTAGEVLAAPDFPDRAEPVLAPGPLPGDAPHESTDPLAVNDPAPAPESAANSVAEIAQPLLEPEPEPVGSAPSAPPLHDLSFVRQARRRAFWQTRGVRVMLGALALGLALMLGGQVVFHHRDRLAAHVPILRPALVALCDALQCRVGPPRRIEAIAIESSTFTRLRADAFRLSLTLHNRAELALALPALEITLTDLQDQPVLRRVLELSELGPQTPISIEPQAPWSTTFTVAIGPEIDAARIVGYRVLAFYP